VGEASGLHKVKARLLRLVGDAQRGRGLRRVQPPVKEGHPDVFSRFVSRERRLGVRFRVGRFEPGMSAGRLQRRRELPPPSPLKPGSVPVVDVLGDDQRGPAQPSDDRGQLGSQVFEFFDSV
jgi:hypothetical protein